MAFNLINTNGEQLKVSGGHWAVYLTLAEMFGWKPAGTVKPTSWPDTDQWHSSYDTSDAQLVSNDDAKLLAQAIHRAALDKNLMGLLDNIIGKIEKNAENAGLSIPDGARMKAEDFAKEFSPLLMFLYKGAFNIN